MIYIVLKDTGTYDDYEVSIHRAFRGKAEADDLVRELNKVERKKNILCQGAWQTVYSVHACEDPK
jgi:hypothetical protein